MGAFLLEGREVPGRRLAPAANAAQEVAPSAQRRPRPCRLAARPLKEKRTRHSTPLALPRHSTPLTLPRHSIPDPVRPSPGTSPPARALYPA